ncbi:MAG TPA: LytR C-terminal domain-containing protein [Chitinivibrionales bacterium]|nr:LytR C-terminal domain-containing protein [Chitinivibrionales bacterium]
MKNAVILLVTGIVLIIAMVAGLSGTSAKGAAPAETPAPQKSEADQKVPSIGRIQVLNGCGIDGAAKTMANFLRARKFDVKDEGNAKTDNYARTMVVSHTKDQAVARQVAQALGVQTVVLIRNGSDLYDVTVFVGADFKEHVR